MPFSNIRMETRSVFITGDGREFRTKKEAVEHTAIMALTSIVFGDSVTFLPTETIKTLILRRGEVMATLSELED